MWLGADPEFVVIDEKGSPRSAHLAGIQSKAEMEEEKKKAYAGTGTSWEGSTQVFRDGFGAEFNPKANNCIGLLLTNLYTIVRAVEERLPKGWALRAPAAVLVNPAEALRDAPEDVHQVGCNPSFSAYGAWGEGQSAPWLPQIFKERMFSGHIHFSGLVSAAGESNTHKRESVLERLRLLDLLVGVPMTWVFADEPEVFIRRRYYGLAGEYRLPTYGSPYATAGLEWRTPDATIWRHPAIAALFLAMSREVLRHSSHYRELVEKHFNTSLSALGPRVQQAINTGEGLRELLMPSYKHNLCKGGFPEGDGSIDQKAFIELRAMRAEFFGPEMAPLGTYFHKEFPGGADKAAAVTRRNPGRNFYEAFHATWPEYPLLMPSWKKYLSNAQVG